MITKLIKWILSFSNIGSKSVLIIDQVNKLELITIKLIKICCAFWIHFVTNYGMFLNSKLKHKVKKSTYLVSTKAMSTHKIFSFDRLIFKRAFLMENRLNDHTDNRF